MSRKQQEEEEEEERVTDYNEVVAALESTYKLSPVVEVKDEKRQGGDEEDKGSKKAMRRIGVSRIAASSMLDELAEERAVERVLVDAAVRRTHEVAKVRL